MLPSPPRFALDPYCSEGRIEAQKRGVRGGGGGLVVVVVVDWQLNALTPIEGSFLSRISSGLFLK